MTQKETRGIYIDCKCGVFSLFNKDLITILLQKEVIIKAKGINIDI